MKTSSRTEGGFALLELLIGATIFVTLMAASMSAQTISSAVMNESVARTLLQESALFGVKDVAHEVRWCDAAALIFSTSNGASRVDLRTPVDYVSGAPVWSNTVTYEVVQSPFDSDGNGTLDDWRLVRTENGTRRTICDHVAAGGFTATRTGNQVTLQVRLLRLYHSRPLTADFSTVASLRN